MQEDPERTSTDEGLRETSERMRAVIENAPVVVFLLDREGVVTLSGGKGMASFGMRPGDTVGESALAMDDLPEVVNVRRALAGEEVSAFVKLGEATFETRYTPVRPGEGGEVTGVRCGRRLRRRRAPRSLNTPTTVHPCHKPRDP